ncbi:MAG: lipid II flippase MurJ [Candidatus Brocadiaceae bacterium]
MIKNQPFIRAIASAFSVSIIAQVISYFRQILIAAYFGIARELDVYFTTYAMATMIIFTFYVIFDTVAVPQLIRNLEEKGHDSFKKLTGSVFTFSLCLSLMVSVIFILIVPLLTKFMAAGFTTEEKKAVWTMAFYFIPLSLISIPYYALCSFYKSIRRFNVVFLSEIATAASSVVAILIFHPNPWFLPVAYFIGYFISFIFLFSLSFRYFDRVGNVLSSEMKKIYRNFLELLGANQIGSLSSAVERFFQSFLPSGGISALTYSAQMTMAANNALICREIFIVPLSSSSQRTERLEKLVIGLTIISIPVMFFISYYSRDIVTILFQHGRFDMQAVDITSGILSLYVLSLMPGVIGTPVFRMFQIIDRIKYTGIIYLIGIFNFVIFGAIFVFYLKMGTRGIALTITINTYLANCVSFYLIIKNGIHLNMWRIFGYLCYAILIACIAVKITQLLPHTNVHILMEFLIKGFLYVFLVVLSYLPFKQRLFQTA